MIASLLADAVLVLHLAFVAFAALGAALLPRWPRLVWLHLSALAWAAWVEFANRVCPLTPLENALRRAAGEAGYAGGFVEYYLVPLVYPPALTREAQWLLGALLLAVNAALYARWWRRRRAPR
jgi:hypothetical protein